MRELQVKYRKYVLSAILEKERKKRGYWECINDKNKGYNDMLKVGIKLKWFVNTQTHAYIAWFGHIYVRNLVGTHATMIFGELSLKPM